MLFQSPAGAVEADGGVIGGDAGLGGEFGGAAFLDVDELESMPVFGLEVIEEAGDAFAYLIAQVGRRLFGFDLAGKGFEGAAGGSLMAVMVDDGIAQETIEPGDDAFFVAEGATALESTDEGSLEEVFGEGGRGDAFFKERKELVTSREEQV